MAHAPEPVTRGEYSADDRDHAVNLYLQTGSIYQVQKLTGIPKTTLQQWRHSEWWGEVVRQIRDDSNAVQEAQMSKTLDTTLSKLNERLEQGDPVWSKDHGIEYVPLKSRDLAYVAQVLFDRRQLLRGGNVAVEKNTERDLGQLTKAFIDVAKQLQRNQDEKVVHEQTDSEITNTAASSFREAVLSDE